MPADTLTPELIDLIADRFRALSEPARLLILNALRGGPRTVTDLVHETHLGQANVSKHLSVLRGVGLVVRRRSGAFVHYTIPDARLYLVCDLMCEHLRADMAARREVVA